MTDAPALPPSTALLNAAIIDPAIGDAEFRTYARLYALAWRYDYQRTDPLDYETDMIPMIGSHGAARRHMNKLRAAGYLEWTTNGAHKYIFTFTSPSPKSGTCDPASPANDEDPSPTNGTPGTTFGTCADVPSPKSGTPGTKNGTSSPKSGTRKAQNRAPVSVGTVPTDSEGRKDRLINLINLTTYPNLSSDARLEKILAATEILFGEPTYRPTKQATFLTILAHLAQAYDERQRGVGGHGARKAFSRIQRGWRPEPGYLADPFAYLPVEFLEAAGLEAFIPTSEDPAEQLLETPEPDIQPAEEPDPSVLQPVRAEGPTAARAWSTVIGQLQQDMPRSAFDQWVRPARLVRYSGNVFEIGAPNELARNWLKDRLGSVVTRHLTGVCNRSVAVSFVVEGR